MTMGTTFSSMCSWHLLPFEFIVRLIRGHTTCGCLKKQSSIFWNTQTKRGGTKWLVPNEIGNKWVITLSNWIISFHFKSFPQVGVKNIKNKQSLKPPPSDCFFESIWNYPALPLTLWNNIPHLSQQFLVGQQPAKPAQIWGQATRTVDVLIVTFIEEEQKMETDLFQVCTFAEEIAWTKTLSFEKKQIWVTLSTLHQP